MGCELSYNGQRFPSWAALVNAVRGSCPNFFIVPRKVVIDKLISTSFAVESKNINTDWQPTLFETENPNFNIDKTRIKGKIFTLERDTNENGRIDVDDLEWQYLEGDGDFKSDEVTALRNESDIIITNPPFSIS